MDFARHSSTIGRISAGAFIDPASAPRAEMVRTHLVRCGRFSRSGRLHVRASCAGRDGWTGIAHRLDGPHHTQCPLHVEDQQGIEPNARTRRAAANSQIHASGNHDSDPLQPSPVDERVPRRRQQSLLRRHWGRGHVHHQGTTARPIHATRLDRDFRRAAAEITVRAGETTQANFNFK